MYSVYIVDDEALVVDDLVNSIPWLDHGFVVVGCSTNPQHAFTEIVEKKPDAVFCDLRMPVWDGIALIRRLKDAGVAAEYFMLSAFADFETSRDFFLMDGFDYLRKPLDGDTAALVLEKLSRRLAEKHNQSPSVHFVPSQSKNFDGLVAYVMDHFDEKITLRDLSHRFNISPTYICNLFAKHYGSTLTVFITSLRMAESSRLIRETDTPLKVVAELSGYTSYHHFCRVFKTHFGMPPSLYRENAAWASPAASAAQADDG